MSVQEQSNSIIELTTIQSEKIEKLQTFFNQADALVKEVEDFIGEAGIPALNEMRYAGYHLAHSILLGDCKFCDEQITSAINHCKRACYEASEAGIVMALIKFEEFRDDYKTLVVSDVLQNWQNIQKDFRNVHQTHLEADRAKGDDDRSGDYDSRMTAFRTLRGHCENIECARDDLNVKLEEKIVESRRFIVTSLISIAAIVVAAGFSYSQLKPKFSSENSVETAISDEQPSSDSLTD